jgi:hypothetical protein
MAKQIERAGIAVSIMTALPAIPLSVGGRMVRKLVGAQGAVILPGAGSGAAIG